jgi:PTS system mannose-specific IIA component
VPEELVIATESVLGTLPEVSSLCCDRPSSPSAMKEQIEVAVDKADQGRGVLLLADLCGSTLANACYEIARDRAQVDVLCGVNLSMLTKLYAVDRTRVTPTELARMLAESGRKGIALASDSFAAERGEENDH